MARASVFSNKREDVARSLARAHLLFGNPPKRGSFAKEADWTRLQDEAFGRPFLDYLDEFITPLTVTAGYWGTRKSDGVLAAPIISPSTWLSKTKLDASHALADLDQLVISREDARAQIRLTPSGLPLSPAFFYKRPFVRLGPDALVALSPEAVYGQLRMGIWARFLRGAKRLVGSAERWSEAFGYLTEQWCQMVAQDATAAPACRDRVVEFPGEEVEDVVLTDGRACALFSVKSRPMDERFLRHASSERDVINWFDEVLFRQRTSRSDKHRDGALRQLDAVVRRVRAGRYEPVLPRDIELFPVLVTFEELFDTCWLQQWVGERCARHRLFEHDAVRPVVLTSVSHFELLLGLAARGVSALDVLSTKASSEWRHRPFQHVMAHMSKGLSSVRPPIVEAAYRDVMNRSTMKMFRRRLPEEHQAGGAMETVTVTKDGEPYNQPGFIDLPLSFKRFEPDYEDKLVRLGGKAVHQMTSTLSGFRDKRFDMRWEEQVFRRCRVVEEQADSAVVEYESYEEVGE